MHPKELKYWLALHSVDGIGAATYLKLIEKFGSPRQVFSASHAAIAALPRLPAGKVDEILQAVERLDQMEGLISQLDAAGIDITTLADDNYPRPLRSIKNPPPILYIAGRLKPEDNRSIAIVGSREATPNGLQIARGFGQRLAQRGYTVISGYAKGIDTASHLGALEGGGRTIMVLSTGIMHFKLRDAGFESIDFLKDRGAIISEMFPTATWTVGSAMARNRLVVGLAQAVLVVECKLESGTMNTARVTQQRNKPLFVLKYNAIGEHILGNEALLKKGAIMIRRFADIQLIENAISNQGQLLF